ncbi:MAG: putative transcription factor [Rhodobacteraceae bacterium HLUCCA08]|nr:MAG: putative transcription factor [Rhodobacteraceae bacterium HLUCCA08]
MTGEDTTESAQGPTGAGDWYSEEQATFGDRLAGAREAAGLSQKDLARRMGIKLSTLRNWEDDLNEPRANKLQMAAGVLGVSIRWLLTGEGDGPDAPDAVAALGADAHALLAEMRTLRAQMLAGAERMGQLEKRLRTLLQEAA